MTATAADNVRVVRVEFYDGSTLKVTATSAPYVFSWAVGSSENGSHSFTVRAFDEAGNSATSSTVTLTVNITATDTTAPTVSLTAPSTGAVLTRLRR